MAWDGSGGFSRTNGTQSGSTTWANARDVPTNITAAQHDTHDQDVAVGIAACLTKNNESKPTSDFKPVSDNTLSLGSTALRWLAVWCGSLKVQTGAFAATVSSTGLTANRALEFPDVAGTLAISGEAAFAVGTRLIFQQTAAPSGWTKQTGSQYNDAAIRLTTGTVSTGGADAFTTHFGTSKTTASMTLATSQIPSHLHSLTNGANSTGGGDPDWWAGTGGGSGSPNTNETGGGGSHNHTLNNFNLKFADSIVAAKA